MKLIQILSLTILSLILTSCAYFTRKSCEKINWFARGEELASRGQYPSSDPQLKECKKAEAEIDEAQLDLGFKRGRELYCRPERAFQVGKEGKLFAPDICEQSAAKSLMQNHQAGVRAYCVPETGKLLGASGAAYNAICPSDLEAPFKSAYRTSRRGYLEGVIPGLERELQEKQNQLGQQRTQLSFLQGKKAVLQGQLSHYSQVHFSDHPDYVRKSQLETDFRGVQGEVSSQEHEISRTQSEIDKLLSRITGIKGEIAGLQN